MLLTYTIVRKPLFVYYRKKGRKVISPTEGKMVKLPEQIMDSVESPIQP